jgi:glyceraldehyde 3-phosphate dehydrogenase
MPDVYNIVHMNDIAAPESIAYLLKYDSIHGTWGPSVTFADGHITITDGSRSVEIAVTSTPNVSEVRACPVGMASHYFLHV